MKKRHIITIAGAGILTAALLAGCQKKTEEVVVYTAVDQVFSEQIFEAFEKETGIKVQAVYDTEANKTTGLVNRIEAEKEEPVCDVFWNNEFVQTIDLAQKELLAAYVSPQAEDIPAAYKDADGYWTAFGGRARVFLVNTELLTEEQYPTSVQDFVNGTYPGKQLAMAYPLFGTTKTMAAALYAAWGEEAARAYFQSVKDNGVQIVDGNSVTKDMAAAGQAAIGFTDTDDAKEAIADGAPVVMVFPDQEEGGLGTLITPNTVALIKGAPHEENAKKFMDFVMSEKTEEALIEMGFFDVSVRQGSGDDFQVKGMDINLNDIYAYLETAVEDLEEIFAN